MTVAVLVLGAFLVGLWLGKDAGYDKGAHAGWKRGFGAGWDQGFLVGADTARELHR